MKSLVALWVSLIGDASSLYHIDPSRDLELVTRRHRQEGDPFLTITLDAYRVAFEAALEAGTWDNILIPGFRKDGRLPAFLRGFVSLVFQRDGQLHDNPDWSAIRVIRQLTGFAAKQAVPCDPRYTKRALTSYISVDEAAIVGADAALKAVFASLFDHALCDVSSDITSFRLMPRHGNGVSQDKLTPNARWEFAQWEERLEPLFPSWYYTRVNDHHLMDVGHAEYAAETTPTRVSFVPKTAKGPRTIAIEPSWRMFIQQALRRSLCAAIERYHLPPRFTSSEKNRELARMGSVTREWATIDLSAASDSVSSKIVWDLFSGRRILREALFASRSGLAELPDGTTHALNKFASMGSAVCFPVESMVFAAIAVLAMCRRNSAGHVILSDIAPAAQSVTVYGDDIIVPSEWYQSVTSHLEAYGFRVNLKKSFYQGFFRESCGADYFQGHSVSYVKVRRPLNYSMAPARDTVSTVSLRNQLAEVGIWSKTVESLDREVLSGLGLFPYGVSRSGGLTRQGTSQGVPIRATSVRLNSGLQRPEFRALVVVPEVPFSTASGWALVHASLTSLEETRVSDDGAQEHIDDPSYWIVDQHQAHADVDRWVRAGHCGSVKLKARWLPVWE